MAEPTIRCPSCKTEIHLTESLAAPLLEATKRQFEQKLTQKDAEIAQREKVAKDKERELVDAKAKLDEQVEDQVQEKLKQERIKIIADAEKKASHFCC